MKTNIEALVAALSSSDEGGGYLDERETSVVVDGTYTGYATYGRAT